MIIEVSEYYKLKGYSKAYYTVNKENRGIVSLRKPDGEMHSMSNAKYVYTSHYKCDVAKGDQVDHINGDKTDDRIENLQVISQRYNINKDHQKKEMVEMICPVCGCKFLMDKRNIKFRPDACCSRSCGGFKSIQTAKIRNKGNFFKIDDDLKNKLIELRNEGLSFYKIAELLNKPRATLQRYYKRIYE